MEWNIDECPTLRWALMCFIPSIPFHLSQECFFPTHSSRKMNVIHRNKVYHRSSSPYFSSTRRIDFLASPRGPDLGRSFDVSLPSHRDPKLESAHEALDSEFVWISAVPFHYANYHRFLKLANVFSFPCSKNSILEEM
ncbi:hypothetical protein AVEN_268745-1 [Araneus ventricosus]|uniref:Uncharacterized protein n=1 Tax=Araneus ventricosus TaxID=182803 RepID=A0A4Y2H3P8_ARAVE|nr:hypothetical protein AVEN_268745-1 [Araneus ventricosus]